VQGVRQYDQIIKGGHVIDVRTGQVVDRDIGIKDGRIVVVDQAIEGEVAGKIFDATGCYVAPGFIDFHTHIYEAATWSSVDCDEIGPETGVTSWVDAGSAGALTFRGFEELVARRKRARIRAFLNIASIGLAGPDFELANLAYCDAELCMEITRRYPERIVGIKVRMGSPTVGKNGLEPLRRAISVAENVGLPVMVHVAFAPPSICEVIQLLRPGDVLTHCYTGVSMRISDENKTVYPDVRRGFERGVLRDVGHGAGSFSFESAEIALEANFPPDIISTELHTMSLRGPASVEVNEGSPIIDLQSGVSRTFDLPVCLSKFLAIGMSLCDVIRAATASPANVLGLGDEIGFIESGYAADLVVFELESGSHDYHDMYGNHRVGSERIAPRATFLAGELWQVGEVEPDNRPRLAA
jgi:dihydroorotase